MLPLSNPRRSASNWLRDGDTPQFVLVSAAAACNECAGCAGSAMPSALAIASAEQAALRETTNPQVAGSDSTVLALKRYASRLICVHSGL